MYPEGRPIMTESDYNLLFYSTIVDPETGKILKKKGKLMTKKKDKNEKIINFTIMYIHIFADFIFINVRSVLGLGNRGILH